MEPRAQYGAVFVQPRSAERGIECAPGAVERDADPPRRLGLTPQSLFAREAFVENIDRLSLLAYVFLLAIAVCLLPFGVRLFLLCLKLKSQWKMDSPVDVWPNVPIAQSR